MRLRLPKGGKDLLSGCFFVAAGGFALWISTGYAFGTARSMGPGFFPGVLACLLVAFGLALVVKSFISQPDPFGSIAWRPLLGVLGGTALFALLIRPAGLAPAIAATVVAGSFAHRRYGIVPALLLAACLGAGSIVVFVYLLGQPLPLVGYWFG